MNGSIFLNALGAFDRAHVSLDGDFVLLQFWTCMDSVIASIVDLLFAFVAPGMLWLCISAASGVCPHFYIIVVNIFPHSQQNLNIVPFNAA